MVTTTSIRLDAPAPVAARYTLRGAADSTAAPDGHWMLGASLVSYPLSPASGWAVCESSPADKETSGFPDPDPSDAFIVYLAVTCTTRGLDRAQVRSRALSAFQVYEDAVVEDQFWNGTIASDNPHLTDTNVSVLGSGAQDVVTGFALMEQELAENQQSGMIHLSPRLATYALAAKLVARDGNVLRTGLGTIVIPGLGYDGSKPGAASAPAAGTEYAYVTNMVRVIRSETPDVLGASDIDAIDRNTNDFTVTVEREYLVVWDGAVQAAVLVDPTPALV
jgi:hypothetical protein